MKDKLDKYLNLQKEIYDYFGYVEDWRVLPIDDRREMVWFILNNSEVHYAEKIEDFKTDNYYADEIYTQRHLPKWVYEAKEFTMIVVDTHTDGNQFLAIYDNGKKIEPVEEA